MAMEIDSLSAMTPMMAQWQACKNQAPEALLLFRLGDFYEAFYEDAILISKELDLTLTKRQDIPMAGVPFHTCESYIDRLVNKGYRIAVAEQMEDAKNVKGIVKRELVRIITPGTVINSSLLSEKAHNYLACIVQINQIYGMALIDITTAEFIVMEFENERTLLDELVRLKPTEVLLSAVWKQQDKPLIREMKELFHPSMHFKQAWYFDHQNALRTLLQHFKVQTLDGFGLKGMLPAINAAGSLLIYLKQELNLPIDHLREMHTKTLSSYLSIDRATQRNLELTFPLNEKQKETTLLYLIDETLTPMGGRLLKDWLIHPLMQVASIHQRQKAVTFFVLNEDLRFELTPYLKKVRDLERMIMRIETGFASPRDLIALCFSLEQVPLIFKLLQSVEVELIATQVKELLDTDPITKLLRSALVEEPPLRLSDGGIIRSGFHSELDRLRNIKKESHEWIVNYQTQLKESTGIKTLKIGYTKAFGYYIETSRGASEKVPANFQRKQTLVNNERYITAELKDFEHKMLTADERILGLESELFHALRKEVTGFAKTIRIIANALAHIDCLQSLAKVAKERNYVLPLVDDSDRFEVLEGRHPVIEAALSSGHFIANDIHLDAEQRLALITGPNMAGKSTYIRGAALIAILAQIGSFVPAKKAHIGIIDKVFSRIGANDDLSRGQSTFMVEMTETANILKHATNRSLIILDEIGRGTSTYDGISIAWAVAEYLLTQEGKRAKTLFATHYFELTQLPEKIAGAVNYNVSVKETDKGIVFLRKILQGAADKSYGIHVARLAGIPFAVIKRAEEILHNLENETLPLPKEKRKKTVQFELFAKTEDAVCRLIEELKIVDPDQITPLEALQLIVKWKKL